MLLTDEDLSEEQFFQSAVLGWLTEILQGFFIVCDDIADNSVMRRGKSCWYRREAVGMRAINDAILLESLIYSVLKEIFYSHPAYIAIIELFHDITLRTSMGQLCDQLNTPDDNVNDPYSFSMVRFQFIAAYKTAYYSFYLPVVLSLHLIGIATAKNLKQAEDILIALGKYFQIQDDYLDNFGLPQYMDKIGTDIKDNKCTWLINKALQAAGSSQREILESNYGQQDETSEARIKNLYEDLELKTEFLEFEKEEAERIHGMIAKVDESEGLNPIIFQVILEKIFQRRN
ncbi:hypothetical protein MY5147_009217 [Beauveria neobassiana]